MINIKWNDKNLEVPTGSSLLDVLMQQEIKNQFYAVAVNQNFISRAVYAATILKAGDVIDIVMPMQGG